MSLTKKDELCEYCVPERAKKADPNAKGCGKRMCTYCDTQYPYTICLICNQWHRMPNGFCDNCRANSQDSKDNIWLYNNPDTKCYGACNMIMSGCEAVCRCRYNKYSKNINELIKDSREGPEEP
jgi:hypothetical protein